MQGGHNRDDTASGGYPSQDSYPVKKTCQRGDNPWDETTSWTCHALNRTSTNANPNRVGHQAPRETRLIWTACACSATTAVPQLKLRFVRRQRQRNNLDKRGAKRPYLGQAGNQPRARCDARTHRRNVVINYLAGCHMAGDTRSLRPSSRSAKGDKETRSLHIEIEIAISSTHPLSSTKSKQHGN